MADLLKAHMLELINELSDDLEASWDSALSWAALVDALAGVMVDLRHHLTDDQIQTLATAAMMAQHRAMEPSIEPMLMEAAQ